MILCMHLLSGTLELSEDTITIYNAAPEFKLVVKGGKVLSRKYLTTFPQGAKDNPLVDDDGKGGNMQVYQQNTENTMNYIQGNPKYPIEKNRRQKRDSINFASGMTPDRCSVSNVHEEVNNISLFKACIHHMNT